MAFTPDDNLAPSRFSSGNRLKDAGGAGLAVLSALSALPPSMGKPLLPFTRLLPEEAEEPPAPHHHQAKNALLLCNYSFGVTGHKSATASMARAISTIRLFWFIASFRNCCQACSSLIC